MDGNLLGIQVGSIRDPEGEGEEAAAVARAEPPPVYDAAKHKSGIVPELQCAGRQRVCLGQLTKHSPGTWLRR